MGPEQVRQYHLNLPIQLAVFSCWSLLNLMLGSHFSGKFLHEPSGVICCRTDSLAVRFSSSQAWKSGTVGWNYTTTSPQLHPEWWFWHTLDCGLDTIDPVCSHSCYFSTITGEAAPVEFLPSVGHRSEWSHPRLLPESTLAKELPRMCSKNIVVHATNMVFQWIFVLFFSLCAFRHREDLHSGQVCREVVQPQIPVFGIQ